MSEATRRRGGAWPWFIGAILLGAAAANGAMVLTAAGDPSFVIEPDYYEKAVAWDARLAEAQRSAALGWTARFDVHGPPTERRVTLRLADGAGAPITDAHVQLRAFHRARAADRIEASLTARDDAYVAVLQLARAGLWQVQIEARRGAQLFVDEQTLELDAGGVP